MKMSKLGATNTVSSAFLASADEAEAIFTSYRELHSIYASSFKNIEANLDSLPVTYKEKVINAHRAFENVQATVQEKQKAITKQLYAQGLVLLVGNAESLTREMFQALLTQNIRKLTMKKNITLSLSDILAADDDIKLARLIFGTIESEGNPTEKLNFQNMKTLQGILDGYLGIKLDNALVSRLHEFWQIRHIIIHNGGTIDKRFIDNMLAAKLSIKQYKLGEKVMVSKKAYDECFGLLALMFQALDNEIDRLKLVYNMEII